MRFITRLRPHATAAPVDTATPRRRRFRRPCRLTSTDGSSHEHALSSPSLRLSSSRFPSATATDSVISDDNNNNNNNNNRIHSRRAFVVPLLTDLEVSELLAVCGQLGNDSRSDAFATRRKSIAFVTWLHGQWFQLHHNFILQARQYNVEDTHGLKQYYCELPPSFLQSKVTHKLLCAFARLYEIGDGELILLQFESSVFSGEEEERFEKAQGIHSDGANRAMRVCLERENVEGARDIIYSDGDGEEAVLKPFVLEEGHVMFWKDNEVYHYVEPGRRRKRWGRGYRSVLSAHYPAMHLINGQVNPDNRLPPSGKHPAHVTMPDVN